MQAVNLILKCAICQKNTHVIPAVDVTSLKGGEIMDGCVTQILGIGWSIRRSSDQRVGRFLVCPECLAKETTTLPPFTLEPDCPKCSARGMRPTYKRGNEIDAKVSIEHIDHKCSTCGYSFATRPLCPTT